MGGKKAWSTGLYTFKSMCSYSAGPIEGTHLKEGVLYFSGVSREEGMGEDADMTTEFFAMSPQLSFFPY